MDIAFHVPRYCLRSLEAYSQRTDRELDGAFDMDASYIGQNH